MLLFPIGREDSEIQRHAWVSYFIIAMNIVAFVLVGIAEKQTNIRAIEKQLDEALRYAYARPYLRVPPELLKFVDSETKAQLTRGGHTAPSRRIARLEQQELDELVASAMGAINRMPHMRFGYIPAQGGVFDLVTSMFVHAGFLHLLGNLLFFFASGPFVEDVFGRPMFAALYLFGGIAATLSYALRHPESTIPLVGASGAIAAVMGAYLVRFFRAKVEFLFVPFLLRPTFHFRFFLPAFVVLPLWLLQQLVSLMSEDSGSGVAFSAHVGGFIFGMLVALLLKVTKFEERFVTPVVLKQTTWKVDDRVVDAIAAHRAGDYSTSRRQLNAVLAANAGDIEALRLSIDVARDGNDPATLDAHATRLLSRYAELKDDDLAQTLINDLSVERIPLPKFFQRAGQYAERAGERGWAVDLYQRALDADPNSPTAVPSLIKLGTLMKLNGDFRGARAALQRAREHPACSDEWGHTIDAKLAGMT